MRISTIDRALLLGGPPLPLPHGQTFDPIIALEVLDRYGLPDGYPFALDDDGTADGCHYLNRYLLEGWQQRGLALETMRKTHIRFLTNFLRFLRARHADDEAAAQGQDLDTWLAGQGEPKLDLTDATRDDLLAYKKHRLNPLPHPRSHMLFVLLGRRTALRTRAAAILNPPTMTGLPPYPQDLRRQHVRGLLSGPGRYVRSRHHAQRIVQPGGVS